MSITVTRAAPGLDCTIQNTDCTFSAIATLTTGNGKAPTFEIEGATYKEVTIHACLRCGVEYINAAAFMLSSLGADEVKLTHKAKAKAPRARGRR